MRRSSSNECWKEVKTEKERSGNDAKRKEGSGHEIEGGMTQRNVITKCFDLLWDIWCIIINSRHSKFGWLVPASPCITLLSWIFESDDNRVCVCVWGESTAKIFKCHYMAQTSIHMQNALWMEISCPNRRYNPRAACTIVISMCECVVQCINML